MARRNCTFTSADGTTLSASEYGNPAGREVLFVHGIAQTRDAFVRQFDSDILAALRLCAFDLRGHGDSGKPTEASFYVNGARWADDLKAAIDGFGLQRPVLVGWSLGGRVVSQYLESYGDARIAALHFVSSRCAVDPNVPTLGPAAEHLVAMTDHDPAVSDPATERFVRACFNGPLGEADFEAILAYNRRCLPSTRKAILSWSPNFSAALARVSVPTLISHGTADAIVLPRASELTAAAIPGATLSWYSEVGHSPFWEDSLRFNHELRELTQCAFN